jgi:hypothetical protein
MASSAKTHRAHSGGDGGIDSSRTVLDNEAVDLTLFRKALFR